MYADKIAALPVFATLGPATRRHLARIIAEISTVRVLKKDEVLYALGASDDNTGAILVEGGLTVSYDRKTVIYIQPPELFGEMQQFNARRTRTATVRAAIGATVLVFSWDELFAAVQACPDFDPADLAAIREAFVKFADDRLKRRT